MGTSVPVWLWQRQDESYRFEHTSTMLHGQLSCHPIILYGHPTFISEMHSLVVVAPIDVKGLQGHREGRGIDGLSLRSQLINNNNKPPPPLFTNHFVDATSSTSWYKSYKSLCMVWFGLVWFGSVDWTIDLVLVRWFVFWGGGGGGGAGIDVCISSSPTNSLDGTYLLLEGRPRVCLVCPSY